VGCGSGRGSKPSETHGTRMCRFNRDDVRSSVHRGARDHHARESSARLGLMDRRGSCGSRSLPRSRLS
jgi:hypothetical protein